MPKPIRRKHTQRVMHDENGKRILVQITRSPKDDGFNVHIDTEFYNIVGSMCKVFEMIEHIHINHHDEVIEPKEKEKESTH